MVAFYRPAKSEDFELYTPKLPSEVINLVERWFHTGDKSEIYRAVTFLYEFYGNTKAIARERIREYQAYLLAKKDHEEGKIVYIEYSHGL